MGYYIAHAVAWVIIMKTMLADWLDVRTVQSYKQLYP